MKLLSTCAITALIVAVATPALAQTSSNDEIIVHGKYLYSDQVNALKSPTPIIDVPQSLSIVTADQITNQGFDSVSDIINYIPGVTNSQGEGHRDAVVFRGVRSTADFFVVGRLIARSFIDPNNIPLGHSRFEVPSPKRIVYAASRQ